MIAMNYRDNVQYYASQITPALRAIKSLPPELYRIGADLLTKVMLVTTKLAREGEEIDPCDIKMNITVNVQTAEDGKRIHQALNSHIDPYAEAFYKLVREADKSKNPGAIIGPVMGEVISKVGLDVGEYILNSLAALDNMESTPIFRDSEGSLN